MIETGLIDLNRLRELFRSMKAQLYRYPDLDAAAFEQAVERVIQQFSGTSRSNSD